MGLSIRKRFFAWFYNIGFQKHVWGLRGEYLTHQANILNPIPKHSSEHLRLQLTVFRKEHQEARKTGQFEV